MDKNVMKNVPFLVLVLAVVASALVFLPALKYADADTTYTGMQLITGVSLFNLGPIASGEVPFSFLALLAFALPAIAGVIYFLSPKFALVPVVLLAAAAILVFTLPLYTVINVSAFGGGATEVEVDWVLQYGAIISGSISAIAALLALFGFARKA